MGTKPIRRLPTVTGSKQSAAPQPPVLAAVCGLFCSACTFYIGTHEDPARLERLAAWARRRAQKTSVCDGCRSERRLFYCNNCHMFACALERGYASCGECPECPCPELRGFHRGAPPPGRHPPRPGPHRRDRRRRLDGRGHGAALLSRVRHPQLGLRPHLPQVRTRPLEPLRGGAPGHHHRSTRMMRSSPDWGSPRPSRLLVAM